MIRISSGFEISRKPGLEKSDLDKSYLDKSDVEKSGFDNLASTTFLKGLASKAHLKRRY